MVVDHDAAHTSSRVHTASNTKSLPAETIDFAHRMFDAAREGNSEPLLQAVDAGLPVNLTNDKGNIVALMFRVSRITYDALVQETPY